MAQATLRISVDISFLKEIIDRRCHLNKIGKSTRALDDAIETEVAELRDRINSDLRTDDGNILMEYFPSERLLRALSEVESQ